MFLAVSGMLSIVSPNCLAGDGSMSNLSARIRKSQIFSTYRPSSSSLRPSGPLKSSKRSISYCTLLGNCLHLYI